MPASSRLTDNPIVRFFTSLELTIVCLLFGMLLILVGTLAQVDLGIHQVQQGFFHSWVAWWAPHWGSFHPLIPIPGGYLVGGILLLNLIAAFIYRFEFSLTKGGLLLSHFGIILLLIGELLTGLFQEDSDMQLSEGETRAYVESQRRYEFAVIETTDAQVDRVLAIDERELEPGRSFQRPEVPFRMEVREHFANSAIMHRGPQTGGFDAPLATTGTGAELTAREIPRAAKQDQHDVPTVWVELFGPQGSLGTWMVIAFDPRQTFTFADRTFSLEMRPKREYLGLADGGAPYSLKLLDFSHDVYPGTEIPRNFSSRIQLEDPHRNENREVLIYMNHPLRYGGLTFYQASYRGEFTTILQVVRNPSRHLPYIACTLVFLGLAIHFTVHLVRFLERRRKTS